MKGYLMPFPTVGGEKAQIVATSQDVIAEAAAEWCGVYSAFDISINMDKMTFTLPNGLTFPIREVKLLS